MNDIDQTALEVARQFIPVDGVAQQVALLQVAIIEAIKKHSASSPLVADLWQPIETAPKDGTAILLTNGKDVAEGHWFFEEGGTTEHRDLDGRYIGQTESDGYDGWMDWDGGMQPDPTHWMPLPAPPEVPCV